MCISGRFYSFFGAVAIATLDFYSVFGALAVATLDFYSVFGVLAIATLYFYSVFERGAKNGPKGMQFSIFKKTQQKPSKKLGLSKKH